MFSNWNPLSKFRKSKKVILQLCGSADCYYYAKLSVYYGQQCVNALQDKVSDTMEFKLAYIHPSKTTKRNVFDALWSFPLTLNETDIANAPKFTFREACLKLVNMNISACVTHMFDNSGTEQYRQVLTDLNIPFIGSNASTMRLSNNKHTFAALMRKNGIPVPNSISFMRSKDNRIPSTTYFQEALLLNSIQYPVIVKPCTEDNSIGITLVKHPRNLRTAIKNAFKYDNSILIEQYIELGREIRVAVIEDKNGEPNIVLPCIEYCLSEAHPIRTVEDKPIGSYSDDELKAKLKQLPQVVINCEIDGVLKERLKKYVAKAHKALKATDFSLYDLRIDAKGNPYFIEANLFCSFAAGSIIVLMGNAADTKQLGHVELFKYLINKACQRKQNIISNKFQRK